MSSSSSTPSAFAPLSNRTFRDLWIAALASNAGSWMHNVAAAWLMTSLTPSPVMASLVQTASSLPMFLLALVAGAVADSMDRRRLLLIAQTWMLAAAALLGVLTLAGRTTPWILLLFTFALGLGSALTAPAWAATIPELVPPEQLPQAVTLNSIQFNIARALGPAAAGAVLAWGGPGGAFLVNALSFVGVVVVVYQWNMAGRGGLASLASLGPAVKEGLAYVRTSRAYQHVLFCAGLFVVFGSALWALLPVVARTRVAATESQYGLMLSSLGAGAAIAGIWLAGARSRWRVSHVLAAGILLFAGVNAALSRITSVRMAYPCLLFGGFAWIACMSSLNVAGQRLLPNWVRARGISVYLLVFQGSMASSSWIWGGIAAKLGVAHALLIAAFGMAAMGALVIVFPLRELE